MMWVGCDVGGCAARVAAVGWRVGALLARWVFVGCRTSWCVVRVVAAVAARGVWLWRLLCAALCDALASVLGVCVSGAVAASRRLLCW